MVVFDDVAAIFGMLPQPIQVVIGVAAISVLLGMFSWVLGATGEFGSSVKDKLTVFGDTTCDLSTMPHCNLTSEAWNIQTYYATCIHTRSGLSDELCHCAMVENRGNPEVSCQAGINANTTESLLCANAASDCGTQAYGELSKLPDNGVACPDDYSQQYAAWEASSCAGSPGFYVLDPLFWTIVLPGLYVASFAIKYYTAGGLLR